MITNQNWKHLNSTMKDNKSNDIKIRQRITEATSGLNNHYFTMMAKRMSAEYYYFGVMLRKDLQGQNQSLFNN